MKKMEMLVMEDVVRLLSFNNRVLTYNSVKADNLKNAGFKVTPRFEYVPNLENEDRVEIKKELVGYMIEK